MVNKRININELDNIGQLLQQKETLETLNNINSNIASQSKSKKEADVKKTAAAEVEVPKGKVQLQTASVEESESDNSSNKIREANKRLVSSFRSNDGVY